MKKSKIFLINGLFLTITTLILRSVSLIFNIYIANKVGTEAIGIFSLLMSVYLFAITVTSSGIGIACTYLVSEEFAKKDYSSGIKAVKICLILSIFVGIFTSILLSIAAPIISRTFLKNAVSCIPIYCISLGLPLISVSSVINGYFSAVRKPYKSAISQILETLAKIFASIFLLTFLSPIDIEIICLCLLLADVISEIFSFTLNIVFYLIDIRKYSNKRHISNNVKQKIFNIAVPISITSCIRSGLSTLKQFLIPARLSLSGMSYSLAVTNYGLIGGMVMPIIMFASVFIYSFSNLLIPEFCRLFTCKYFNRLKHICNIIFELTAIFSLGITAIFFIFANDISFLVYKSIESGKWLKILSPLIFFIYLDNIIDNMLKGINAQVSVMICNIIDLAVTISIIFFIVPIWGLNGYIFSIFVSEFLNFAISSFQLRKKLHFSFNFQTYIIRPLIACITSYFILIIFRNFFENSLLQITIFSLLYFLITLFLYKFKQQNF